MSESTNIVVKPGAGEMLYTGLPPTITVSMITEAIEKSDMLPINKIVIIEIITKLTDQGIEKLEDVISDVYNTLIDKQDLWAEFVEIIKSIAQLNS